MVCDDEQGGARSQQLHSALHHVRMAGPARSHGRMIAVHQTAAYERRPSSEPQVVVHGRRKPLKAVERRLKISLSCNEAEHHVSYHSVRGRPVYAYLSEVS